MKRHTPADLAAAFPRGLPVPTEHEEQAALFQWAALHLWHEPRLELLYAIPNGGARHPAVAAKLKVEGVKPGVPDVCLPVAAGSPLSAAHQHARAVRRVAKHVLKELWRESWRLMGLVVDDDIRPIEPVKTPAQQEETRG